MRAGADFHKVGNRPRGGQNTLGQFDDLWATQTPQEQTRVVELLVFPIDYDAVLDASWWRLTWPGS